MRGERSLKGKACDLSAMSLSRRSSRGQTSQGLLDVGDTKAERDAFCLFWVYDKDNRDAEYVEMTERRGNLRSQRHWLNVLFVWVYPVQGFYGLLVPIEYQ